MVPAVVIYNQFDAAIRRIQRVAVRNVGEGAIRVSSDALVNTAVLRLDTLTPAEFAQRLQRSVGVTLTADETRAVVAATDAVGDGRVGVDDVLAALRSGLRPMRRVLVDRVLQALSLGPDGAYRRDDILAIYRPEGDPRVVQGVANTDRLVEGVRMVFPAVVLPQHVTEYFVGVSIELDDDEAFADLLRSCWIPPTQEKGGEGKTQASLLRSVRRVTAEGAAGTAPAVTVAPREAPPPMPRGSCAWAARATQPTSPWPTVWNAQQPTENSTAARSGGGMGASFRTVQEIREKERIVAAAERRDAAWRMMDSHRQSLQASPMGYRLVGRALRRKDPARSGVLSEEDFLAALWQCRLYAQDPAQRRREGTGAEVSDRELLALYRTQDMGIDYMRYLYVLVPPLRPSRRVALERLWATLPRDAHDRVDVMTLQRRYHASSGHDLNDFLSAWDRTFASVDGRIGIDELEEYYAALSERMELDAEFRRLLAVQWPS